MCGRWGALVSVTQSLLTCVTFYTDWTPHVVGKHCRFTFIAPNKGSYELMMQTIWKSCFYAKILKFVLTAGQEFQTICQVI